MKHAIAIYLQHYLSPSMTFIYRQLKTAEENYNPIILCSDKLENTNLFPFESIYFKRRNFIRVKKSRIIGKLVGWHRLLGINPVLSKQQKRYFSEVCVQRNIKLIHAHFGPSGLEIVNIARHLRLPLIVTFHGYDASILLKFRKYIKRLEELFEYANIIAVSDFMKRTLVELGANEDKVEVIRCGIPVNNFKFKQRIPLNIKLGKEEVINFLQVSNFVEKKGHEYTVKAFNDYLKSKRKGKLILAGEGPLKRNIRNLCEELGISSKVSFPGLVDQQQVIKMMNEADIFLHHSITARNNDMEGIPTAIMEAMATGLPVISTYHSGIPELITNNINGILVSERDISSYTDVLCNINKIHSDMGIKARKTIVENFNLDNEMKKIFHLYNKLLSYSD
jgi:colanic acid/amylovoran biosynthesis glycosyltransferase